jgi:hypothetical protein
MWYLTIQLIVCGIEFSKLGCWKALRRNHIPLHEEKAAQLISGLHIGKGCLYAKHSAPLTPGHGRFKETANIEQEFTFSFRLIKLFCEPFLQEYQSCAIKYPIKEKERKHEILPVFWAESKDPKYTTLVVQEPTT